MSTKRDKHTYTPRQVMSWLWRNSSGCRVQATANVGAGLAKVLLSLAGVEALRRLTDIATGSAEGSLAAAGCAFAVIMAAELGINIGTTWLRATLGVKAQNNLQRRIFGRLLNSQWSGIEKYHSGDIMTRLSGDVYDIISLITEALPSALIIIVQFAASFIYLYSMDTGMALIVTCAIPFLAILSRFYFGRSRRIVRRIKECGSAVQSVLQESIQHRLVIKTVGAHDVVGKRLEGRQSAWRKGIRSRAKLSILARGAVSVGFTGGYIAALMWGLYQLQSGLITVGVLFAFTQLVSKVQRPLVDMARLMPSFTNSYASTERLMDLEQLPTENAPEPLQSRDRPAEAPLGVRLKDVCFSYDTGKDVLRNLSHDFAPGTFTAVTGETGKGKTTILRLILALIHPASGQVCVYGKDGESPVSAATRTYISYVPQGNSLLSGTIRDNLLLACPEATESDMRQALRQAVADFVLDLPEGLDTVCGEQGGGLSEGQAQRIAIARGFLRQSSILLLDEATSALDTETETLLLRNLAALEGEKTVILVTHRAHPHIPSLKLV